MAVYFIRSKLGIKVGFSDDVESRLKQLQTGNACRLKLMAVIPRASRDIEQEFHLLFAKWRMEGEWFQANGPVLRTVELIRQGAAPLLREHLRQIAEYAGKPRAERVAARPPAIVPTRFRGTEVEVVIRDLDFITRDSSAPQNIVGKAHVALRHALRGQEFDVRFLDEYKAGYLTTSRATPNVA